jgi:hypothetical protein
LSDNIPPPNSDLDPGKGGRKSRQQAHRETKPGLVDQSFFTPRWFLSSNSSQEIKIQFLPSTVGKFSESLQFYVMNAIIEITKLVVKANVEYPDVARSFESIFQKEFPIMTQADKRCLFFQLVNLILEHILYLKRRLPSNI